MENVHEETYRNFSIKIFYDNDAQSPEDWKDENVFLVGYHRDFTVDRGQRELITIFNEEEFKKDNGYHGRVYADGEPLPKLGQVDPDFKGNKWMPAPTQAK